MLNKQKFVCWFKEIDSEDIEFVGQKTVGLAEMTASGISIPSGFCLTPFAYYQFLKNNNLVLKIKTLLGGVDLRDPRSLITCSQAIKKLILSSRVTDEIAQEIIRNYLQLGGFLHGALVAVRSSPIDERLYGTSFLNVRGEANVVEAVKKCWASFFDPENLCKKENILEEDVAVLIQKMVQSRVSGVIFSTNPEDKMEIIVRAIYGLGELAVEGKVFPDEYKIRKDSLRIIKKEINRQLIRLIKVGTSNKETSVSKAEQSLQKLTDKEIVNLAKLAKKIQQYYFFPQEIEFAIEKRRIFILETQPLISRSQMKKRQPKSNNTGLFGHLIDKGIAANPGIVSGFARVMKSPKEAMKVKNNEILVSQSVNDKYLSAIRKIAGLVIEEKDFLSYGAMISRELGIPCVAGVEKATQIIKTSSVITINGETGEIFKGGWKTEAGKKKIVPKTSSLKTGKRVNGQEMPQTGTKIYVNLNNPQIVEAIEKSRIDGVIFQPELLLTQIGVHPKKLLQEKKEKLLLEKMTEGLNKICQGFSPKPVIYKILDFRTDEYRILVGGGAYETEETNPLLGFHGCSRYIADPGVFEWQLEVIEKVRKNGLKNLSLMIPFVRTSREFREIKKIIISHNLVRSPSFKLWAMLEVPANVFLVEDLIQTGIDGVCLRLPELLNLTLAVDGENKEVFWGIEKADFYFQEIFEKILKTAQKHKLLSLVLAQEKFLSSDLLESLVGFGVNGICTNPDAILRIRDLVAQIESQLVRKKSR